MSILEGLQELLHGSNPKIIQFLRLYVINNKAKNSAASAERTAKKNLLTEMLKCGAVSVEESIQVGEETFLYRAEIGDVEETEIDPEKVFKYINKDMKKFMSLISITKETIKDEFGETAVISLSRTNIKHDVLKISNVK